jgi:hypothetical protein
MQNMADMVKGSIWDAGGTLTPSSHSGSAGALAVFRRSAPRHGTSALKRRSSAAPNCTLDSSIPTPPHSSKLSGPLALVVAHYQSSIT